MTEFDSLVDAFLAHFWLTHPVDASFAGLDGYDCLLPPAGRDAPRLARDAAADLQRRLAATPIPDTPAARIDACLMRGYLAATGAQPESHSSFFNPAWYTGEVAFALIALLLPAQRVPELSALRARVAAIPDFLSAAQRHLVGRCVPADWVRRAATEVAAIIRLFERGFSRHPLGANVSPGAIAAAVDALLGFERSIKSLADADPAAGASYFDVLVRDVHCLTDTPATLERLAAAEFARLVDELQAAAERLDPHISWRACIENLTTPDVFGTAVAATLRTWHDRAFAGTAELVTGALHYALDFAPLPDWAVDVYADLYFLFYRSPAAYRPGSGSPYWVTSPQSTSTLKLVHAVHHGSIGHHTQNARAREASSQLARIAGADGASGIALLGGGTMAEGWPCYAEELLAEVAGFYTPHEVLLLKAFELRNVATALGDLRLHTGRWSLTEMRAFYRDEAAFSPARIWSETTRNSIYPASRIMYWTGSREIKKARAQSELSVKSFHDRVLAYGTAPVAAIAYELARDFTR